jgi:alkaline phosphatase
MAMGNENINLSFEEFPYVASSKTYCVDEQVADSACTATAYLHGVKANSMTIGVNGNMRYSDCVDTNNRNKYTESIALWAQQAGKATGVVTNTRITHASPAGVYSNTASRYWEDDNEIRFDGCEAGTINDIAMQLVHGEVGSNLNVILGGGARAFIPNTQTSHGSSGRRRDGRNLINEWLAAKPGRTYVNNREGLMNYDINRDGDLFGLFNATHMSYNHDRTRFELQHLQPTLEEMSVKAVDLLSKKEEGFFLFIEGGRIDHGHHGTEARIALDETIEFQKAVKAVVDKVNLEETLIVVTADHGHVFTISGYPHRGNDIFGLTASNAQDGMRIFTLSYANGPGRLRA